MNIYFGKNDAGWEFEADLKKYHAEFIHKLHEKLPEKYTQLILDIDAGLSVELRDNMKSRAGWAKADTKVIALNYRLHKRHPEALKDTYGHELAHIVAGSIRPREGHGRLWQSIMSFLGLEVKRCHNLNTDGLKAKRRKFTYYCACPEREHQVGIIRHRKLKEEGKKYYCTRCEHYLCEKGKQPAKAGRTIYAREPKVVNLCASDEKPALEVTFTAGGKIIFKNVRGDDELK